MGDHKIPNVRNESRCEYGNSLIVQDEFAIWIQSYPMKTKVTLETMSCLRRFLTALRKPQQMYKVKSKEII